MEGDNILLENSIITTLIPEKLARKYNIYPINIEKSTITILSSKENISLIQDLKLITGKDIRIIKSDDKTIEDKISELYIEKNISNDTSSSNILNEILEKALESKASDVHIEPFEEYLVIRNRIDGELKESIRLVSQVYPSIASLIKLNSGIDITEKRVPQDGSMEYKRDDNVVDIRVSTTPTIYGEKIVLRILNRSSILTSQRKLGFSEDAIETIRQLTNNKSGIVLVTGATGSGKTTTVYSILNDLKNKNKNIMTIEDPVEYRLDGINQIQVNSKVGLDFELGLKSILRQDPDIIMVGEIRDIETARVAIRAAITGHLVISTLHTNDAISTVLRLLDMGIEPYLISESIIGIISQKLVRKVCDECSHSIIISDDVDGIIGTKMAKGCKACDHKGYVGRTIIYEIVSIDEDIKKCINQKNSLNDIREVSLNSGMISFEESYSQLIQNGITTLEESCC